MQIDEVAQKTGLSVDAIRFYEKAGLLPAPARYGRAVANGPVVRTTSDLEAFVAKTK